MIDHLEKGIGRTLPREEEDKAGEASFSHSYSSFFGLF